MSAALAPAAYGAPTLTWRNLALVLAAHGLLLITLQRMELVPALPEAPSISVDLLAPPVSTAPVTSPAPSPQVEKRVSPRPPPAIQPSTPLLASAGPSPATESAPSTPPAPAAAMAPAVPVTVPAAATLTQPRYDADYLHNPAPAYPPLSRRLAEEGKVLLRVFVDTNGRAGAVEIKQGSGSARLDQAAADAVAQWKFFPARRGDEAVGAWVLVPIIFSLKA